MSTFFDGLNSLRYECFKEIKKQGKFNIKFTEDNDFLLDSFYGAICVGITNKEITYLIDYEEFTAPINELLISDITYIADNISTWIKYSKI